MLKSIEMTGATRDLAIEKALSFLQKDRDDVSVEVLDNGRKGFLGIGATEARVKITYEAPDEPSAASAAPAAPKPTQQPALSADDPRLTTPHLVKPAPKKDTGASAAPQEKKEPAPRRERERAPRQSSAPHEPIVPYIDPIPMDEDKVTEPARQAQIFINGLLEKLNIEGKATVLSISTDDHIRIEISGPDMGPVIGRRGDTLDAIQYLTSLVLNKFTDDHIRLTIDTENYRAKRAESLERLAHKMAIKVSKYHKAMTLEPMNPYERRIIHAALQEFRGVTTYSTGSEPGRRVVISPDDSQRTQKRGFQPRNKAK